ncbi:response regulator transcription factor [Aquimarina aquimarini]|uniref:response regulator transcription factor n=1 Tax=Aquimarina aquimarini TaxID=1191734 RepID=UPI000D55D97D|nr:LuxR C-terminal-related transcriptional regulator [Aquimarina aquimarini]
MKKTIFIFTSLIIALLALFQISKYHLISQDVSIQFVIATIAVVFFIIGSVINKKTSHSITVSSQEINQAKINELGISNREHEVLCKVAEGLSNKEIAHQLYVSENTIKTHVSNLLAKLNAKRRTQAIQIAKKLKIIPL